MGTQRTSGKQINILAFAVLLSLMPQECLALFFPFENVLETLQSPRLYRAGELSNRIQRSDIVSTPIAIPAEIPRLKWTKTQDMETRWQAAKELKKPGKQLKEVERQGLRNLMSSEVSSLTSLGTVFQENFLRRDTYRDRIYASPEFIALMKEAIPLLHKDLPGEQIMVGDVSQVGAGPLVFGTTVELLSDSLRSRSLGKFLEEAFLDGNQLVRNRVVSGHLNYPEEKRRWKDIEGPIWVEERLTGAGTKETVTYGRVERRRFYRSGEVSNKELGKWWKKKKRSMKKRYHLDTTVIQRGGATIWKVRWVRGRTLIEGEFSKPVRRSPLLKHMTRLRIAQLAPKKPGSLQKERRYFMAESPDGSSKIIAWRQLYEAGHISHINGRDADLSYIMKNPDLLFSRSVSHIDVQKTRRWFELLYEASISAGVEIEALLVDGRVRRRLLRRMSKEQSAHPVWSLLTVSKGHDSHVHVRLKAGFYSGSKNARHVPAPSR